MSRLPIRLAAIVTFGAARALAADAAPPPTPAPAPPTDVTPPAAQDGLPVVPSQEEPSGEAPPEAAKEPTPARPQAAPKPRAAAPDLPNEEEAPPDIAPAWDTVGGHLSLGLGAGFLLPFGSVDSAVAQSDVMGPGLLYTADVAYGVSHTVKVGAYGELGKPSSEGAFSPNGVTTLGAGVFARYHLAQGTRFDPWLSYGVGFRSVKSGDTTLTGIDWARFQVGGDWYAFSPFGLGPLLEVSMGTYLDSSTKLESKAVNAQFVAGLHLVFDAPGK